MGNKTSVKTTAIGGSISAAVVAIAGQFLTLTPELASAIVVLMTLVINYYVPEKKV